MSVALTGLEIFKQLPKTNCGDCGVPTCLAFAMKLAQAAAELGECPHVTDAAVAALSEASAPPIRGVEIGSGDSAFKVGEELVMFRHEKTFYNNPGYGLQLTTSMDDAVVDSKLGEAKASQFERVGQLLKADCVAIKNDTGDASAFAALSAKALSATGFPLILMSDDPEAIKAAVDAQGVKDSHPLLYAATDSNHEAMTAIAKEFDLPLVVKADSGSLEDLSALTERVAAAGIKDIVLDPGTRNAAETHKNLVHVRRSALKSGFKPLGYPVITFPCEETDNELLETMYASLYTMKYGGIMVLSGLEAWKVLPLTVLRQNIFTDPQRPMQVEEGMYPINNPTAESPVILTTNFSLTYFMVTGEVEASKVPTWIAIMDAEGMSVLTAWAAGKFVPDRIAKFIGRSGAADKVNHNSLIIPGYVAQMSGELEDELNGDWKIQVGSREATDLTVFLRDWSAA